jgi:hypothetical protein
VERDLSESHILSKQSLRLWFVICIFCSANVAVAKEWKGIVPLQSKKEDVIRLLGVPSRVEGERLTFGQKDEDVFVIVSDEDTSYQCGEDLALDTVMAVEVVPRKSRDLSEYHLNLSHLEKFDREDDSGPYRWYWDQADGFALKVVKGRTVKLEYMPGGTDAGRCPTYYHNYRAQQAYSAPGVWEFFCPSVVVRCPDRVGKRNEPVEFAAGVIGGPPNLHLSYKWAVSSGAIIEGQGTSSIKVDVKNVLGPSVKATVEVGGMPRECPKTFECNTEVVPKER